MLHFILISLSSFLYKVVYVYLPFYLSRWRGRNGTALRELNPKTLTSGLDDYPRASHPSRDERHLDLRCWMALASRLMSDIGQLLGRSDYKKFESTARFLYNNDYLEHRHWSAAHQAFLDWGLHTDDVSLQRPKVAPGGHPGQVSKEKVRVVISDPQLSFVNNYGYVSLFPFLLQAFIHIPNFRFFFKKKKTIQIKI